jgi:hypothetical protein
MRRRTIKGRELDAQVAHAMGYSPCGCGNPTCDLWEPPAHLDDGGGYPPVPHFATDPVAARLLEDEIERRGWPMQWRYVSALWASVGCAGHNGEGPNIWKEEWLLIRATPEQRVRAFLEAIGDVQR